MKKIQQRGANFQNAGSYDKQLLVRVKKKSIVMYWKVTGKKSNKEAFAQVNKSGRSYNGYMSKATSAKVRGYIEQFAEHLRVKTIKRRGVYRPTFVTLTLPSQQSHSDNEVKRECLNHFLIRLKRDWKVKHYIWRAEPQKNGNIHFHIILGKWVAWRWIRDTWNELVEKLGYVSRFQEKNGHRDPNSTDVHAIEKVNDIGAYMCKYMTKDGSKYETRPDEKKVKRRKIEGRIWGCSDSIRSLVPATYEIADCYDYLQYLEKNDLIRTKFVDDFFTVIYLKYDQLRCLARSGIRDLYRDYFEYNLNSLS